MKRLSILLLVVTSLVVSSCGYYSCPTYAKVKKQKSDKAGLASQQRL